MKTPQEVYEEIISSHQELERIPPDVHLFCPKVDDEDFEDYDDPSADSDLSPEVKSKRIQEGQHRLQLTSWASLILGISREQADRWLVEWIRRTESFLVKCDSCVRAWHMGRKALKAKLVKEFDEETANIMEGRLHEYDTARINRGLKRAVEILEQQGPMSSVKLVAIDTPAVLALYEALCCVEYLSLPDNRRMFNYVFQKTQEKRPLKLTPAVIPTMTVFLFQADPVRNRFARSAWERKTSPLTADEFEWAVSDHLADAIDAVSRPDATDSAIELFWDGFLVLLGAMSEEIVLHCLRGMQIPLDVYQLAVKNLERGAADVLAHVLRALCALMDKSSKAFWDALSLMNPPQLPMFVTASPAFGPMLVRSFEDAMQLVPGTVEVRDRVPLLVAFVRSLMRSLNRNQRADVCDYFLSIFLSSTAPPAVTASREGHSICVAAGLNALQMTLEGYLDARYRLTAESALFVNTVINNTVKHQDYVVRSANLHVGDRFNVGLSEAALKVVEFSLALDTRAIHDEWHALQKNARLPLGNERRSNQLWDGYRTALAHDRKDMARVMLAATLSLRGVQRFSPKKKQLAVEDETKRRFNTELDNAAEAIAATIERISETLTREYLQQLLCSDAESGKYMDAVVGTLVHAEDAIRGAGFQLISTVVDEDGRSEAIAKMVHDYPALFLASFVNAVDHLTGGGSEEQLRQQDSPFEPMRHVLRCSKDVLNGLCDTSGGLLRSRSLTPDERNAVKHWWVMQWQFVDHSFLRARPWSEDIEKSVMENYVRDVMEFAELLMAQDGLIASALRVAGGSSSSTGGTNPSGSDPSSYTSLSTPTTAQTITTPTGKNDGTMQEVLDAPRKYSMGLAEMIQLRDVYLVGIIVQILVKLFTRLNEFNMHFPGAFVEAIRSTYTPQGKARNRFKIITNMNDTQRAELMKAVGDGGDEDDSGVEIISWSGATKPTADAKKKQTTIEAWSRTGTTATTRTSSPASSVSSKASPAPPSLSSKDAASQLTPGLNKHRALLEKIKSAAAAKPDQKALLANRAAIRESRARDKAEMEKHKAEAIARARALRGGPPAPIKSDIMVDSASEEEEAEDESEDDGVSELVKHSKKTEELLDDVERRRRLNQQMAARLPVKKVKLQRSAKDMRARIIPNMDRLHQAILEWDIFHEGNDPPNSRECEAVADAYPSPAEYKRTFFPLLISEAWRSFVTDKDETVSKPFGIKVITRMSVDNFLEVSTSIPAAAFRKDRDRMLGEGDIVLLSQSQDPLTGRAEPHCLARIWKIAYKRDNVEVTYRLNSRGNQILPVLLPGAEFHAVKITNMTTIEREFAALESLQYYDLMDEIIKATPSPMLDFGEGAISDIMKNYELNRGQALAILHGRANDGFTLVQGPPGTGKTKTIVAMVGALLTGHIKVNTGAVAVARPGMPANANSDVPVKKLLVCAPSNAAVDELVLRLKMGVKETTGATRKINVLRLGRSDAINAAVKDVTLDELVTAEINRQTSGGGANGKDGKDSSKGGAGTGTGGLNGGENVSDREKMHQRAKEIKEKLQELMPALEAARAGEDRGHLNQLQREHDQLRSEQRRIGAQIERDKESGNTYAREAEIKRRQIQQKILNDAHVLCATLSGSGHEVFKNLNVEFETVIIDEAAQCVELSALIPLKYGCAKCILVGDPKQLPPTVLSLSAARYGYDQSLFVRMQRNRPKDVHLLDTQYRMHPEISRFPSKEFYESRLVDGGDMARLRTQPWHGDKSGLLGPYRFFDVEGVQERGSKGQSLVNPNEVRVALQLYKRFITEFGGGEGDRAFQGKIGIITPYKAQLYALRQRFADEFGSDITSTVEFNTTDAFQGRECEIIIFSCVRASPTGGIGFMTDIRRMNVGLTRARSSLWILGDSRALRQGEFWRALIEDAKERKRYTSGNILAQLRAAAASSSSVTAPSSKPKPVAPPSSAGAAKSQQAPPKGPKAMKGGKGGRAPSPSSSKSLPNRSSSVSNSGGSGSGGNITNKNMAPSRSLPKAAATPGNDAEEDDDAYSPPPAFSSPDASTASDGHQQLRKPRTAPQPMSTTYTVVDRPSRPAPAPSHVGMGGLNERGEPLPYASSSASRPVIVPTGPAASVPKKRPHETGPDANQPVKRPAHDGPPRPPVRRPTDPSAMEVLGINKEAPPRAALPPRPPMRPPKKKGPVDPFIKKKAPKRM